MRIRPPSPVSFSPETKERRRRADILALEHSHGRISQGARDAGRRLQAIFEKASRQGVGTQSHQSVRVDRCVSNDTTIVKGLEDARTTISATEMLQRTLGVMDTRIVREILRDGRNYGELAAAMGRSGDRGAGYLAQRFRDALEQLGQGLNHPS